MSLSKPANILFDLIGTYFQALYNNPIRTKSLTSGIVAALANLISQRILSKKSFDQDSFIAYALHGLLFGGTIPHFFFEILGKIFPRGSNNIITKQLLTERMIFAPLFQAFNLYMLARLEGKSHATALSELQTLYWPLLMDNFKYLTIFQCINFGVIPQSVRVLYTNLIGFFWVIFISYKRVKAAQKKSIAKQEKVN